MSLINHIKCTLQLTVGACLVAVIHAIYEFFQGAKQQAEELGTTWGYEIKHAMIFALQCHGNTRVSRVHCAANLLLEAWKGRQRKIGDFVDTELIVAHSVIVRML